jgi:hypothetical protein
VFYVSVDNINFLDRVVLSDLTSSCKQPRQSSTLTGIPKETKLNSITCLASRLYTVYILERL